MLNCIFISADVFRPIKQSNNHHVPRDYGKRVGVLLKESISLKGEQQIKLGQKFYWGFISVILFSNSEK